MTVNLSALNGANGFRLDGVNAGDYSGGSAATAGDFNGDGYADIIIGADKSNFISNIGGAPAGEAYVVFGSKNAAASSMDLSSLNGNNGFRIKGVSAGDYTGYSVSTAGDINKDGLDDIIIGTPLGDTGGKDAGAAYVIFGTKANLGKTVDLGSLDGKTGFRLDGIKAGDTAGWSANDAGDVNGDGIDDIVIGAHFANADGKSAAGEAYVVYGTKAGFGKSFDLSSLNGKNGFRLDGVKANDYAGKLVDAAGDINGDGYDDILVGARGADVDGKTDAGATYVVFGSKSASASMDLSSLNGSNGFRLDGVGAGDRSGRHASKVGDLNGDGYDDLAIGSWKADPLGRTDAGETYVIFGSKGGFKATMDLTSLNGTNGFRIAGAKAGDESGRPVAAAGDVNGDGIDDMLIGAGLSDPSGKSAAGTTYVVFGSTSGFGKTLDLAKLTASQGYGINGIRAGDEAGRPAEAAGDVNGDGIDDIVIGATFATADGKSKAGQTYVVFGSKSGSSPQPSASSTASKDDAAAKAAADKAAADAAAKAAADKAAADAAAKAAADKAAADAAAKAAADKAAADAAAKAAADKAAADAAAKAAADKAAADAAAKAAADKASADAAAKAAADKAAADAAAKAAAAKAAADAAAKAAADKAAADAAAKAAADKAAADAAAKAAADKAAADAAAKAAAGKAAADAAAKAAADAVAKGSADGTAAPATPADKAAADKLAAAKAGAEAAAKLLAEKFAAFKAAAHVPPSTNHTAVADPVAPSTKTDSKDTGTTGSPSTVKQVLKKGVDDGVFGDANFSTDPAAYDVVVSGSAVDERLRGSQVNEYILGGDGQDKIIGGAGDDYISVGSGGSGYVRGGTGSDIFEFARGFGTVNVDDFTNNVDHIHLTGGLSFSDFKVTSSVWNGVEKVSLHLDGDDRIILNNVKISEVDASDFF